MNIEIKTSSTVTIKNGCFRQERKTTCFISKGRDGLNVATVIDWLIKLSPIALALYNGMNAS